jgi:hypothetical protein
MLSGFDERGQAIQIGAVLLFGLLIISFASYQAFVVPNQNKQIEFKHSQQVQEQLQDLRNGIVSIPGGGNGRSVSIPLGTQYPSRAFALNPGPATGTLRTAGTTDSSINMSVRNATTDGETGDFWDGDPRNYSSGALVYTPNYNEYQQAPRTIYENTVLYNENRNRNLTVTGQEVIDGRRINLVSLNGSLSIARSNAVAVDLQAVSTSTRTVPVTNPADGRNVTVTVPTRLNESSWRSLLEAEFIEKGGHITGLTTEPVPGTDFKRLEIQLEEGVQYDLRLSRVGVGTGVQSPSNAYLTTVSGGGTTIAEDGRRQLVVEVRDRFNNPVSGQRVEAAVGGGSSGSIDGSVRTTDEDGRATFEYGAPADISGTRQETNDINVSMTGDPSASTFDPTTVDGVSLSVSVENTDGSGLGGTGGLDAGSSGQSTFTPRADSLVVSAENGLWEGVNRTDQILFWDASTIVDRGDPDEYARTVFTIRNATETYSIEVEARETPSGVYGGTISIYEYPEGNEFTNTFTSSAAERFLTASRYSGTDILNRANYESEDNTFNATLQTIAKLDGSTTEITFAEQDGRVNTALQSETLFSAIEPDPSTTNDEDEFVRVHFENATGTRGWTIADDDTTDTLPAQRLQGEYYFTKNKNNFTEQHPSVSANRVFETNLRLANSGESLELRDESGNLRDEVAYGGGSTSNGWSLTLDPDDIGVREKYYDGVYNDTDSASDWRVEAESSFFGGGGGGGSDTTPPTVNSASATAEDTGGSGNKVEQVDFAFDTSDNTAVDRVEVSVDGTGGSNIGSATVNSPSSSSEVVDLSNSQNLQGNQQISVTIAIFDTSGNSRTCTGSIGTVGGTISDGSGLDCSQTSP